ncbi:MAG: hypothetical protein OXQ32_02480 [bacterium]|nr:hypothetical protein [bacterium]
MGLLWVLQAVGEARAEEGCWGSGAWWVADSLAWVLEVAATLIPAFSLKETSA